MSLTVRLAKQEQSRLDAIAVAMRTSNQSDVIRALINEKFADMQAEKTLVERRGGHPQHLLNGNLDQSERKSRKASVAQQLANKTARRKS